MSGIMRRAAGFRLLAALAGAILVAGRLEAHDFWIEPSSFRPAVGSQLAVSLRVGQNFRGDPVPRSPLIARFVLASPSGEVPIPGLPGTDPAGFLRITSPGYLVIGYRSNRSPITLEAEKFEKYLAEEGLDEPLKVRAARGERGKPGNEVYSRCAKSLVAGGGEAGAGFDRILGLTLELVPETNPSSLSGSTMKVRLLYEGRPLAGALVKAIAFDEPDRTLEARSDRDGRVSFRLTRGGVWLVKAVHMTAAAPETGADWESLWASLTFEVPGGRPR